MSSCILGVLHLKVLIQTCQRSKLDPVFPLYSQSTSYWQLSHCKTQIVLVWAGSYNSVEGMPKDALLLGRKHNLNIQLASAKNNWFSAWPIYVAWCQQVYFDVLPEFSLAYFLCLSLNWDEIEYKLQKHLTGFGNCTNHFLLNLFVFLWNHQSPGLGEVEERDLHTN